MKFSRTSQSDGSGSPEVTGFYDDDTGSVQYLVSDPDTGKAALIDTVLTYNPESASTDEDSVDKILHFATEAGLEIVWILDTHPHADHLMASSLLKARLKVHNGIGRKVVEIADLWRDYYNLPNALDSENHFDRLFEDDDVFEIGSLKVRVMLSAGHTLGSITYVVGDDAAFVHDTFMQPDAGTARADFPGGCADELFDTLLRILELPDQTRLFVGHDYGTHYRSQPEWESKVEEQRKHNIHIGGGTSREDYTKLRNERDKNLVLPDRMLHVLQMNLRAGQLPESEDDGNRYLKIPMNKF